MAEDAIYISLDFEDPELKRVIPWTGTSSGPEAFISTFTRVATYWTIEAFEISDLFGSAEDVGRNRLGEGLQDRLLPVHRRHVRHRPVLPFERGMGNPDATRRTDFRGDERAPSSRQGSPALRERLERPPLPAG
jgi:hypothetical protein